MRLQTVSYFDLVKATCLVELAWYTNSKMVQNSGIKSSHMSWTRDARTGISSIWQRNLELCSWLVHMFQPSVDKKSMSVFLLLLSLTVSTSKHP